MAQNVLDFTFSLLLFVKFPLLRCFFLLFNCSFIFIYLIITIIITFISSFSGSLHLLGKFIPVLWVSYSILVFSIIV